MARGNLTRPFPTFKAAAIGIAVFGAIFGAKATFEAAAFQTSDSRECAVPSSDAPLPSSQP